MTCDTCTLPLYERVVDRVKRDGKFEDVSIRVHTDTNIIQCEDSRRGVR